MAMRDMKKRVFVIGLLFAALMFISLVSAQNNESCDENCKINNAYSCIEDQIDARSCSSLSVEEQIFSSLSVGQCTSELSDASDDNECWPDGNCEIKTTAQAIMALDRTGGSTTSAAEWLTEQNQTPSELTWFLQIDSTEKTSCTIDYSSGSNEINLEEDKTISGISGGDCLSRTNNDYWLRIASDCYDEEYSISCDTGFTTNLLYQKANSDTIYVSDETHSASAEGTTSEEIFSSCFTISGSCDYEGTLWSAMALSSLNYEISSYLPYLVAMSDEEDNQQYLPNAFLYALTGEFRNDLLLQQKNSQFWEESGNRYYDTALALHTLQYDSSQEITDSKEWLFEVQGNNGCWNNGNLRDTSFLAYALQPRGVSGDSGTSTPDCENSGYYCMSSASCGGEVLPSYSCSGTFVCCSQPKQDPTCQEQGGEICSSGQQCAGGTTVDASGLSSGQICCYGGSCQEPQQDTESVCESVGGTCRVSGCLDSEQESSESCDFSSDVCCIPQRDEGGSSGWIWIFVLLILIVLVVAGIIYREKLRRLWLRMKSKFGKGNGRRGHSGPRGPRPPGFPPSSPGAPPQRPFQRKMVPSRGPPRRGPPRRSNKELDDVLGKLKKMGK